MIKRSVKFFTYFIIILILLVTYLSIFGVKTNKLNNIIKKETLSLNSKFVLDIKSINILLNPFNFTLNFRTENPEILLDNKKIKINHVNTNLSIKSILNDEFSIDNIKISLKSIKLKDLTLLARSFKNSAEFFLLDKIVEEGFLTGEIQLNFDNKGKIINNYQIKGAIEKGKLSLLNNYNLENLDFIFEIKKDEYLLSKIKTNFNKIKLSSPAITIKGKKNLFLVKGKILTKENDIGINELKNLFKYNNKKLNIEKINFSSDNNFTFNLSKQLKIKDLQVKSQVNLKHLQLKNDHLGVKYFFPNFKEKIELINNKIEIIYNKKQLNFIGNGKILLDDKADTLNYEITKKDEEYAFNLNLNVDQNPFNIEFLNYFKDEKVKSSIFLDFFYNKDSQIKFNKILFNESNNNILIKDLVLNNKYKILDFQLINLNYINKNKIKNKIFLKKNKKTYSIKGKSFDISRMINQLIEEENDSSIFNNFSSKFEVQIDKVYLDQTSYINNFLGTINIKKNKIDDVNLNSSFPNGKKILLTVKKNINNEKITTFFSGNPQPLVKRYKFIKGFDGGILDFYSIKKNGVSNSLLTIDDFKVQEVPVLAKLLSLASLQGIADLLTGEGIRFNNFEMKFSNKKDLMTIEEMYAIGPAVSILMDGYIESKKLVSLRGTLVPDTTINRSIASIPLLGNILIGKKTGEGVFGVSFKIKGAPKDLKTTVNPVKTLTPRFITRTLEKLKKN
jgi:hypothetical protein